MNSWFLMAACLMAAGPVLAAEPATQKLDCTGPIGQRTTAKELQALYGDRAVIGKVHGVEDLDYWGMTIDANPDDFDWDNITPGEVQIVWWDKEMTAVSMVRTYSPAWIGPYGLHVGSSIADVQAVNGKPFSLYGLDWDYGGLITERNGGKLEDAAPGGCRINVEFGFAPGTYLDPDDKGADRFIGEGQFSSDDPGLKSYPIVVSQMELFWPLPAGVKEWDGDSEDEASQ